MVIVIAGKQVDLNAVLPLKLRHWKELEKVGITDGDAPRQCVVRHSSRS